MNPSRTTSPDAELRPHKDARINLRLTARQDSLIRRAAAAQDKSMSDFILDAVAPEAERVLADRRWFTLDDEAWAAFQALLDAPLPPADERLKRLLHEPAALDFIDQ